MKDFIPQSLGERLKEGIKLAFGGLSTAYYTRQAIIGLGLAVVMMWLATPRNAPSLAHVGFIISMLINAALYPYARFVYHKVVELVLGNEEVFSNSLLGTLVKLIMMLLCFMFATLLAPLGLLYLYYIQTQDDDDVEALAANVKDKMSKAKTAVKDAVEKVKDSAEDDDSLVEKIKDKAKNAKEAAEDAVENVKSKVKKAREEYEDDEDDEEEVAPRSRRKKVQDEDEDDDSLVEKIKDKAKNAKEAAEDAVENVKAKVKKAREEYEDDEDDEEEVAPRSRRKKVQDEDDE